MLTTDKEQKFYEVFLPSQDSSYIFPNRCLLCNFWSIPILLQKEQTLMEFFIRQHSTGISSFVNHSHVMYFYLIFMTKRSVIM
jgi:hypothetical protein